MGYASDSAVAKTNTNTNTNKNKNKNAAAAAAGPNAGYNACAGASVESESTLPSSSTSSSTTTQPLTSTSTSPATEGDSSHGGPKAVAALLSLGHDLTKGSSTSAEAEAAAAAAVAASATVLVPGVCGLHAGPSQQPQPQQPQQQQQNPQPQMIPLQPQRPNHPPGAPTVVGTLELVATSDIPMLPTDARIGGTKPTLTTTTTTTSSARKRQRTTGGSKANSNPKTSVNDPPDFFHWLLPGETVGNWDVLCGRGGESNNFIGNKRYRKLIGERKADYRKIDVKQRKLKTNFVRDIVQHIKNRGGRFIDVGPGGNYYVVTDEKARKKTSQALRETKELKWLVGDNDNDENNGNNDNNKQASETMKKKTVSNKDVVCPFCGKTGHKTKISKACLKHHEWLDVNGSSSSSLSEKTTADAAAAAASHNNNNNNNSHSIFSLQCPPIAAANHAVNPITTMTTTTTGMGAIPASSSSLRLEASLHDRAGGSILSSLALPNSGAHGRIARTDTNNLQLEQHLHVSHPTFV
eukprot:CAMPEP_0172362618 /NCGR_PEP_ID=MMETSP1060-20121228/6197_1 /TAXON_ID=37318 /ORGANISM="Pseudo-nitzschia pungens, Strain cf. cingulata" /LENGTH=522 /DNA_ID=CAMNT_0013085169 /DNA_START=374 /DNA_END=1942 /DNA_ORIENTATION=+